MLRIFGLIFCLIFGIQVAGQDVGASREPAVQMLHPVIVKESNARRIAVLLTLINQARVKAGSQALQLDDRLAKAATNHARMMAQKGWLSHQFPGEPDLTGRLAPQLRLDQAGENVTYDVSVRGAHEAFMGSPAHLANLLNGAFDSVGLGIVENGGVLYVVEDFAHRVPDLNNDDAAERVANQFSKFRQTAGAAKLPHVSNGRLQQMACVMAQHEVANEKGPSSLPRAHVAASYESADLSRLPADVARLSTLNGIGYFSVGVCYARTPRYPTGLYWVTIVLFE